MTHDVILILAFSVLKSLGTGLVFSPILFNIQTHLLNLDVLLSSSKLSDPQSFWCKTRKKMMTKCIALFTLVGISNFQIITIIFHFPIFKVENRYISIQTPS